MFHPITPRYTYPQPRKFLKFTHRAWYRSSQAATSPHWDSGIYRWSLIEVTKARQISEKLPTWQGPFSGTQGVIGVHNSVLSSSNWVFNEKPYFLKKRFFSMEIFLSQDRDFFRPRALTKILTKSTKFGENHEKSDILGPKPRKNYEKNVFEFIFYFFVIFGYFWF